MKKSIHILTCLMASLLMTSCQGSSYRYQLIEFENSLGKVSAEGMAKPEVFKGVFEPAIYIGPHIDIPKDANVFGVLIVMRDEELEVMPLYTWQDEAGITHAGCNGPMPQFAHQAKSKEELIQSLARMLAVDEGHREEGALSKAAEEGADWDRARKLLMLKAEDVQAGPTLEERGARQYPYPIVGDTISVERDGWNYSWRIKAPENG